MMEKKKKVGFVVDDDYLLHYPFYEKNIIEELDEQDREKLLKICESEKDKFLKRLSTYLKKYGLSKVHTWTYLVD